MLHFTIGIKNIRDDKETLFMFGLVGFYPFITKREYVGKKYIKETRIL